MSKNKESTLAEIRLACMITMRQHGADLDWIGEMWGITPNYAGKLLCQAGVYEHKCRKDELAIEEAASFIIEEVTSFIEDVSSILKEIEAIFEETESIFEETESVPTSSPVKVGRWTRLAESLANVIKRFKK